MLNQTIQESDAATSRRQFGRSIWAVVAGFLAVVILSIATDAVLHALGMFPALGQRMSNNLLALATFYRTLYAVLGSYITARVAPNRPMAHALIGGLLGMVIGGVGAAVTWSRTELGPHWYPLVLVAEALPCAWIGGKIRETQLSK